MPVCMLPATSGRCLMRWLQADCDAVNIESNLQLLESATQHVITRCSTIAVHSCSLTTSSLSQTLDAHRHGFTPSSLWLTY